MQQTQLTNQHHLQQQLLKQHQIEAITLLSLTGQELDAAIRKEIEENPALCVAHTAHSILSSTTHTGAVTRQGEAESDIHQNAYENVAQEGETLQQHLLFQLEVMHLSPDEEALGTRLIQNLDANGYHTLDPSALLDKKHPLQNKAMLRRMIAAIQEMDPEGTCCNNMEESLFVQAKLKENAPPLALFILDGHIDTLYSNSTAIDIRLILRRLCRLQEERRALSFAAPSVIDDIHLTETEVQRAVSFIKGLNPRPAAHFGLESTSFALPDVSVIRLDTNDTDGSSIGGEGKSSNGIVTADSVKYRVEMSSSLPRLQLNTEFRAVKGHEAALKRLKAKAFITNISWRASLIVKAACLIVKHQCQFFNSDGKAPLEPFTQVHLSAILGVATSTASRLVTAKFLLSPWGKLYPMSYFFTNGEAKAKNAIEEVIKHTPPRQGRPLSDREIAAILSERGINIARRTVAKYRAAIDIPSSHKRHRKVQSGTSSTDTKSEET